MIVTGLAVLLLALTAVAAPDRFDTFPDHLVERVFRDVRDVTALAQVNSRFRRLLGPSKSLHCLLHCVISDSDLPGLFQNLTADIAARPNIIRHLTLQDAAGLYDRLMLSEELPESVKVDTLRSLIVGISSSPFLDLAAGDGARLFAHQAISDLFLALKPPLEEKAVATDVPKLVRDAINRIVSLELLHHVVTNYPAELISRVRRRYPAPFNIVFPATDVVAYCVGMELFQSDPALLEDVPLITKLFHYGLRLSSHCHIFNPPQFPADIIAAVVPLFEPLTGYELLSTMMSYATAGFTNHAKCMLKIARVRQEIRTHPSELIRAAVSAASSESNLRLFFESVPALLSDTIDFSNTCDRSALKELFYRSLLWPPSAAPKFQVMLELMRPHIPNFNEQLKGIITQYEGRYDWKACAAGVLIEAIDDIESGLESIKI